MLLIDLLVNCPFVQRNWQGIVYSETKQNKTKTIQNGGTQLRKKNGRTDKSSKKVEMMFSPTATQF